MELFVKLEKDEKPADEFMMAKAVYDLCKKCDLNADVVSRMILIKTEDDAMIKPDKGERMIGYGISEEV